MIDNPHIGKGILALLLAAILALLGFMGYWSAASAQMDDGLSMAYQNTLFDTSSVIEVDIDISEDNWAALLENATSEEYYDCDVTVNGTTYEHVGLRAKGNTSLSMVASSDSDRYSFKIKFDEYVDGQSCDGLSKLVLNNNYSDATMMKEALCYDMFAFLGADASLYNYAKVSVNGEYRGVYLALEPVEESFAIRNYGTGYGQLYKPDSMEMGGPGKMKGISMSQIREEMGFDADSDDTQASSNAGKSDTQASSEAGKSGTQAPNEAGKSDTQASNEAGKSDAQASSDTSDAVSGSQSGSGSAQGTDKNSDAGKNKPSAPPSASSENPPSPPTDAPDGLSEDSGGQSRSGNGNPPGGGFNRMDNPPSEIPGGDTDRDTDRNTDRNTSGQSGPGNGNPPGGGFGGDSAASLNYIDDELSSYETIWESSVFKSTDKDHRRVIHALKNICADDADAESLAESMDVDNILRYMAVQTFVVNLDSLSGSMAHNYYLYEDDGQLNLIPWDYNLAFGGFQSGSASETINFPIDTPFSSGVDLADRQFFMALLENETYLAQYHDYLSQLVEEYVNGGGFDSFYDRVTAQIDALVQNDPTSFYTYDEYTAAAAMLKETVALRAASVQGQLDGRIPSTRDGRSEDSSDLLDASSIDLSVMGVMNGGGQGGPGGSRDSTARGDRNNGPGGESPNSNGSTGSSAENSARGFPGSPPDNSRDNTVSGFPGSPPDSSNDAQNSAGSAAAQTTT